MGVPAKVTAEDEKRSAKRETHTERLLRLSDEARDMKVIEVTDFSDEGLFKLFSKK